MTIKGQFQKKKIELGITGLEDWWNKSFGWSR